MKKPRRQVRGDNANYIMNSILTPKQIVDEEGTVYDLSTNLKHRVKIIIKSKSYWAEELTKNPDNEKAKKFYKKFSHLKEQLDELLC